MKLEPKGGFIPKRHKRIHIYATPDFEELLRFPRGSKSRSWRIRCMLTLFSRVVPVHPIPLGEEAMTRLFRACKGRRTALRSCDLDTVASFARVRLPDTLSQLDRAAILWQLFMALERHDHGDVAEMNQEKDIARRIRILQLRSAELDLRTKLDLLDEKRLSADLEALADPEVRARLIANGEDVEAIEEKARADLATVREFIAKRHAALDIGDGDDDEGDEEDEE